MSQDIATTAPKRRTRNRPGKADAIASRELQQVAAARAPRQIKTAPVRDLLAAPEGATLVELVVATGWQAHSVRAVISGIRKASDTVERLPASEAGGTSRYRITSESAK